MNRDGGGTSAAPNRRMADRPDEPALDPDTLALLEAERRRHTQALECIPVYDADSFKAECRAFLRRLDEIFAAAKGGSPTG